MPSLSYAYLLATLMFGSLWFVMYYLRSDIRRKMLRISVGGAIAGPVSQYWYLNDYWQPEYILGGSFGVIEDLLFSFFVFGFTAGLINVLFAAKIRPLPGAKARSRLAYVFAIAVLIASFLVFTNYLGLNSIYSSAIGFVFLAVVMWYDRPDLASYSVLGGVSWLLVTLISYQAVLIIWSSFIDSWWIWENISGIRIFQIPIEEFMWFGSWGLVGSIIYEWRHGFGFVLEE